MVYLSPEAHMFYSFHVYSRLSTIWDTWFPFVATDVVDFGGDVGARIPGLFSMNQLTKLRNSAQPKEIKLISPRVG